MGLNIKTLDFLADKFDVIDKRICLLGNLYMARGTEQICRHLGTNLASAYFEDLGAKEVVMIDLNGKDGALPLDLDKPIGDINLLESFDIVIDGGTSEHVKKQYYCFQNILDLCKSSGLMFHFLPLQGHWVKHGRWMYPMTFFSALARYNNYTIVDMHQCDFVTKKEDRKFDLAFVCFRKEVYSVFVDQDAFQNELLPMLGKARGK